MPQGSSRRTRFVRVRRRRAASPAETSAPTENLFFGEQAAVHADRVWHGQQGLQDIATMLWLPSYARLFELEYTLNELECGGGGYQLQPSTYRARLRGEPAERYDARRRQQRRDEMAIALHANNQQRWSPSLLARSISYFRSTSVFIHGTETRQRRMASQPVSRAWRPQPRPRLCPRLYVGARDARARTSCTRAHEMHARTHAQSTPTHP